MKIKNLLISLFILATLGGPALYAKEKATKKKVSKEDKNILKWKALRKYDPKKKAHTRTC